MATLSNLDWNGVCQAIASVYGTDAQTVATTLTNNGVALGDVEGAFKMLKGTTYEIWYNSDGTVRSYNYVGMPDTYLTNSSSAGVSQSINSNAQVATKTAVKVPLNTTASLTEPTKTSWKAGMAQTGNFIFKEILPAVAAANVGITLGKTIDSALYNANPDFWDSHGWGSINPETWNAITQDDDSLGAKVFNTIFKIDPQTNTSQAYLDQDAFAYLALMLQQKGFFQTGDYSSEKTIEGTDYTLSYRSLVGTSWENSNYIYTITSSSGLTEPYALQLKSSDGYSGSALAISKTTGSYVRQAVSKATGTVDETTWDVTDGYGDYYADGLYTYNTQTSYPASTNIPYNTDSSLTDDSTDTTTACKVIYEGTQSGGEAIEGIGTQEGATTPSLSNGDTVAEVLAKLQAQYPDIFNGAVTQSVVQPDGTIKEYTYIPVSQAQPTEEPTDGYDPEEQPISATSTQADPAVDPETATETQLEYIIGLLTEIANPNLDDTGKGNTPALVAPAGSAEALYRVWNPTEAQLNQFGGWLWSSNFVDQLLKVFNDPMQAIIGLHKVFATPSVGGTDTITVGYLDSGVTSNYIDEQYTTVDCGTVSLIEQYQNVFDYSPFTDVTLYLPFIGFVRLDVSDVMRSTINVKYHVDVLTGACLAEVKVIRDMYGGVLYTYSGNCSVTYPLSSGSYMGIVGTIASIAGGIAGTLATGGAAAPMVLGAAAGAMNAHTNIERSGSLSGNSGAMGIKKPYLVISRPQTNLANSFETFIGKPANYTTTLSGASGFVSCTEVHLINCNATDEEIAEIESLLKSGIII